MFLQCFEMMYQFVYKFTIFDLIQGPYVENTRTHLQNIVGDDNVLIVKFADIPDLQNNTDNLCIYCQYYSQVANDGIVLGLRRYRFFSKFVFLVNCNIILVRPIYNANFLILIVLIAVIGTLKSIRIC